MKTVSATNTTNLCQIYSSDEYKKWFMRTLSKCKRRTDINICELQNAMFFVNNKTRQYGIYDKNGKLVTESLQFRHKTPQYLPPPRAVKKHLSDAPYSDISVMFMGNVYPHFGHFIIEHLNRAWGTINQKCDKYVFINQQNLPVPEYLYVFMEMLGIARQDVLILNHSMRFARVYIPAQTMSIDTFYSEKFVLPFQRMAENVNPKPDNEKIYMSRAKLPIGNKTYGEEKIQEIFRRNGFKIIYPETMPLSEQVYQVRNARVLAGCAGTALHLALFMRPGGTVIQLKRNSVAQDPGVLQYLIDKMAELKTVVISASIESTKSKHGQTGRQIIGMTSYLEQFLNDNKYKLMPCDFTPDKNAWHEYTNAIQKQSSSHIFIKHWFIKITACFIPGRVNRGRYRTWLKKVL